MSSIVQSENSQEFRRGEYVISTDRSRIDLDVVHGFLAESYRAKGIPREVVKRSIEPSLCFGAYRGSEQVGFARVIADFATFVYIGDVFVLNSHRGHGLAKSLMKCIRQHPRLQGLRRWMLATQDAHGLYEQFGSSRYARLSAGSKFKILRFISRTAKSDL